MKQYRVILALIFFLSAFVFAQENPKQAPAVSDSAKTDSAAHVETASRPTVSDTAKEQVQKEKGNPIDSKSNSGNWIVLLIAAILTPLVAFLLARLPKPLFSKDERHYRKALKRDLGKLKLVGPGMDDVSVRLEDTFVRLRISGGSYRAEAHPVFGSPERIAQDQDTDGFDPDDLIDFTFNREDKNDVLLVIGDPGSGKSTLVQYYAIKALSSKGYKEFRFKKPVLPLYLPLRAVDPNNTVDENLESWCNKHALSIEAKTFYKWLHNKQTLLLLDGLDEVSDLGERRSICEWIDNTCSGLANARFVVTSRPTGLRGSDKVGLQSDFLQADVHDFDEEQRKEFLHNWFTAAYLRDIPPEDEPKHEWQKNQKRLATEKTESLLSFLEDKKNRSLLELSGIPMLLQIMAIHWKKDDILPNNRSELYQNALNYLLEFRDAQKNRRPLLSAVQAQHVLLPACLWIQEDWQHEEIPKEELHNVMRKTLKHIPDAPDAKAFCENLRDRAAILADNSETEYIFRHKSFREFYAGLELAQNYHKKGRLKKLATGFREAWWEETLRFFVSKASGEVFDEFMKALFANRDNGDLDDTLKNRLRTLVEDAPLPRVDSLSAALQKEDATDAQKYAILECLQTIGTEEALVAVENFVQTGRGKADLRNRGYEILREYGREVTDEETTRDPGAAQKSFHNPLEYNAEYILIPGGAFHYSVTDRTETVPDIYFAKYPVTNKRYRRFIRYLKGLNDLDQHVPLHLFVERLLNFAAGIPNYGDYLGDEPKDWAEKLASKYDDERKFNDDDQPVVGVTWFAARAYCFWLSLFEAAKSEGGLNQPVQQIANIYRLPKEMEWERAAAGLAEEKETPRPYPWGKEEPTEKLANYGSNVGATTPVGRYPDGATPDGLMEMAGNVWEWQENWDDEQEKKYRALRGGSWSGYAEVLRCSERLNGGVPDDRGSYIGFRVVRPQSGS